MSDSEMCTEEQMKLVRAALEAVKRCNEAGIRVEISPFRLPSVIRRVEIKAILEQSE